MFLVPQTLNLYQQRDSKKPNDPRKSQLSYRSFRLEGVLQNVSQEELYARVCQRVVLGALDGYNGSVLEMFIIYPPRSLCIVYSVFYCLFLCVFRYSDVFWADRCRKDLHHDRIHRIIQSERHHSSGASGGNSHRVKMFTSKTP